ncbi:MAG: phosphoribosylformylglycinamidine cyclo-ligase [Actinomycetota bacterium]|nr:phosphoribosylformylglycinamidine cyclo-ligase [Actinomycetota bacterium]MDK1016607.1 phosphoribosylformylglycinamidine cyclo-ligase [Actinomycetota bacterium]MDK1026292.1 phosphoribosylformylglycinamidine cyclo-ligase [Actinomycetota bacterium]MDK1037330.1 phosphoribosylformylglycinamidine cyclo-ligase [Actinomycetota bacterium]MDK1096191.1 phosphoribosylformylglycinamidine cyclo-ligase [Actinomycetota bacterium]
MTSYEEAGVNLTAADQLVERIEWRVTSTWTEDVVGGFGGFAAGLRIPAGFDNPVLMMSTDGIGTKAEIARQSGLFEGLGYDLLAMVADDLAAAGAQTIAMTDYIAVGKLDVDRVETIIESITDACNETDVALLGGETAEHPGVMAPDQFDLVATALGIVEYGEEIDSSRVAPGDVIVGVTSPNLRSNGFSLVRSIIAKHLPLDDTFPDTDKRTAEVLLDPSVVYSPAVMNLLARVHPHGLAHITGGGLPGNVIRILPEGTRAVIERSRWETPHVFKVIQSFGKVSLGDMFRTFNMGIGFACVVEEGDADETLKAFETSDLESVVIGRIVAGDRGVELR